MLQNTSTSLNWKKKREREKTSIIRIIRILGSLPRPSGLQEYKNVSYNSAAVSPRVEIEHPRQGPLSPPPWLRSRPFWRGCSLGGREVTTVLCWQNMLEIHPLGCLGRFHWSYSSTKPPVGEVPGEAAGLWMIAGHHVLKRWMQKKQYVL